MLHAAYERLLPFVEKPGRYVGGERGSIVKDPSSVSMRFALAFPEVYEIGQSHLGLQILYDILNRLPDVQCERVYAPWLDMERLLRAQALPLASLETCTPLHAFDIVGFSLQYELTYTNLLAMLDLGGIPLLADERGPTDPLIIAGGPCAFNPEPIAPFLDAVVLGDGEEVIVDVVRAVAAWDGTSRATLLATLATLGGVYVPGRYAATYTGGGRLARTAPIQGDAARVRRRTLRDLDAIPPLARQIVPSMDIVHDRVAVEVMRGCVKGCRFCQAGYIYRPLRERDPRTVLENAQRLLRETGYEEVSLLSLSTGDYSCINPLLAEVMQQAAPARVAVSLPSTRVDALDARLLEEIRRVRKSGFTLAPEAGTQRLRDVIQKEYREEELVQAAELLFSLGWRSLKLYFMIGLPTETEEDVRGIVELARRVAATGGPKTQVTASVSTFVPKPHTPFQWAPQLGIEETEARQNLLRRELRRHRIQFKWHDAGMAYLEGVFARGDRRLAPVVLAAYRAGCRFDGWTDQFRWEAWHHAFTATDIDPDWYHRRRILDEPLPWDHLDSGVDKRFLQRELAAAFARTLTPDCSIERCTACGACDFTSIRNVTFHPRAAKGTEARGNAIDDWAGNAMPDGVDWHTRNWAKLIDGQRRGGVEPRPDETPSPSTGHADTRAASARLGRGQGQAEEWLDRDRQALAPPALATATAPIARIRLTYQKIDRARFLGNRELVTTFLRACRRGAIPVAFSAGHHPLPRLSFGPALSLGLASLGELVDLALTEERSPDDVMEILNHELPDGLVVIEAERLPHGAPGIDCQLESFSYRVSWPNLRGRLTADHVTARLAAFAAAETFPMPKRVKGREATIDARPLVAVRQADDTSLFVETRVTDGGTVKPHRFVATMLGLSSQEAPLLDVVKVATRFAPHGETLPTP